MGKRVILIVLDSVGIGGAKDAAAFGDEGSHTLAACAKDSAFSIANMKRIGMGCIKDALPDEEPTGQDWVPGHGLKNRPWEKIPPSATGRLQVLFHRNRCLPIRRAFRRR